MAKARDAAFSFLGAADFILYDTYAKMTLKNDPEHHDERVYHK